MTTVTTSYWPADTSAQINETTIGGVLQAAAAAAPEMLAMVGGVPDPGARNRWTYAQLLADAERAARALTARFVPGERIAVWAPNLPEWVILEYGAALAGLVLVTVNPAFRPEELAYVLNQSGAAGIFLVPEFRSPMAAFLDEVRPDVPSLREVIFFTGWADFLDTSAQDRAETLGTPLPQTEIKIADIATGGPVPVGQVGELCARGYMVMRGYHDAHEATAAAIDTDGWYHTGDLASIDGRGYLRIEGRTKDMIIRGGENIYPREIEEVLFAHPAVAEVAVVGIPDQTWGEVVAAFVRPAPGQPAPAAEELRAHCREHLAPYKTPVHWVFVDAFPMTASGKIQKYKLREQFTRQQPT